jgi:hypothetical protein
MTISIVGSFITYAGLSGLCLLTRRGWIVVLAALGFVAWRLV